jgi:hypothetical protein
LNARVQRRARVDYKTLHNLCANQTVFAHGTVSTVNVELNAGRYAEQAGAPPQCHRAALYNLYSQKPIHSPSRGQSRPFGPTLSSVN